MDLREAAALPRHELPARLLQELAEPGPITLSGPTGSGKTHTLHELAKLLEAAGIDHELIHHSDRDALTRLENASLQRIYLFDGIESADYEFLWAFASRIASGASGVGTLSSDRESQNYNDVLRRIVAEHPHMGDVVTGSRSFRIAPLSREDAERIAHRRRQFPLDSVTVSAVIDLAWGRPGWMLDLLQLAASGKVGADPHPSIAPLDIGDLHLPVLRRASRTAERSLTPKTLAAAIVLSSLEPRTASGAADLVGDRAVSALIEARVLVETPHDSRLVGVPEIYAAAMGLQADPVLIHQAQHLAAAHLLSQEALGIPLPEREAMFCAWVFRHRDADLDLGSGTDEDLVRTHARLVGEISSTLVSFGRPDARDLLLRVRNSDAFDALARARAAATLRGPLEGLRSLQRIADGDPALSGSTECEYGIEFLRQQLLADIGTARRAAGEPEEPARDDFERAALLFRCWNTPGSLEDRARSLLDVARNHPAPEISLLAEQLLAVENARFGRSAGAIGTGPTERSARIAALALDSPKGSDDLLAASAVAEGLIALLSGTNITGSDALPQAVERLRGSAFHRLWMKHLFATLTALAAGSLGRAAQEWVRFEQRIPRFLLLRLRAIISSISIELQDPGSRPLEQRDPCHHLLAYFRGSFDTVEIGEIGRGAQPTGDGDAEQLEAFRLAAAHLEALETQNPSALMRIADELGTRGLWAPSAYALQEARSIFLRRRATGSVSRCDSKLHELEIEAKKHVPWFALSALPAAPRTRLTRRELDAAHLAAAGLSNRQISDQIRCSVRTVESHLASARAKLGASNRSELAERMHELGYV